MRFFVQRVKEACVTVDNQITGQIGCGYLVLVGIKEGDDEAIADKMLDKLLKLRIFRDENGKTNCSITDVDGELLIVSQFTLYADCRKGNRPSFTSAGSAEYANHLYEYILHEIAQRGFPVQHGIFGADMDVSLINQGPFSVLLDSEEMW